MSNILHQFFFLIEIIFAYDQPDYKVGGNHDVFKNFQQTPTILWHLINMCQAMTSYWLFCRQIFMLSNIDT